MERRRILRAASLGFALTLLVSVPALAANPPDTGQPGQSCQDQLTAGGTTPGHSASSPGSPFNEPGFGSLNGGTGGQHYSATSQYDVACFQVSQR